MSSSLLHQGDERFPVIVALPGNEPAVCLVVKRLEERLDSRRAQAAGCDGNRRVNGLRSPCRFRLRHLQPLVTGLLGFRRGLGKRGGGLVPGLCDDRVGLAARIVEDRLHQDFGSVGIIRRHRSLPR